MNKNFLPKKKYIILVNFISLRPLNFHTFAFFFLSAVRVKLITYIQELYYR